MRRSLCVPGTLLIALVCFGCEAADDPQPGRQGTDDGGMADSTGAGGNLEDDAAGAGGFGGEAPPSGEARWVAIIDTTEGIGIGRNFGTDVDAVGFDCGGRQGFAAALGPDNADDTAALGAPDGPCDPLDGCAASVGGAGTLLVRLDSGDLAGCTLTVHEHADDDDDRFDVWTCDDASLGACVGPWFSGADGERASGEIP